MEVIEYEHPGHGWGYAIRDAESGTILVQLLNAFTDEKTADLQNSTRALAEAEMQRLEKLREEGRL